MLTSKKSFSHIMSLVFIIFGIFIFSNTVKAEYHPINTTYHSQNEIAEFAKKTIYANTVTKPILYSKLPNYTAPYNIGNPTARFKTDGLNATNFVRYLAGLNSNITLTDEYNTYAQSAAFINAKNNELSHTPSKPANMSQSMYQTGYTGANSSNLSRGFPLMSSAIFEAFMNDGDPSNIADIGHRRWVLNPAMGKTGFGSAHVSNFIAMYVLDTSNVRNTTDDEVVAWPPRNMPSNEKFISTQHPFSISLGSNFDKVNKNKITVSLQRKRDGKKWNFNKNTTSNTKSQLYFNVSSSENTGQPYCIIFRPNNTGGYKAGDVYTVTVNGITKNGYAYPIQYNINFFDLDKAVKNIKEDTTTSKEDFSLSINIKKALRPSNSNYIDAKIYVTINTKSAKTINARYFNADGTKYQSTTYYDWKNIPIPANSKKTYILTYPFAYGKTQKLLIDVWDSSGNKVTKTFDIVVNGEISVKLYNNGIITSSDDGSKLKQYEFRYKGGSSDMKYNVKTFNEDGTPFRTPINSYDFATDMNIPANCGIASFAFNLYYDPGKKLKIILYTWDPVTMIRENYTYWVTM